MRKMTGQKITNRLVLASVIAAVGAVTTQAETWIGGGADNEFSTALNWNNGVIPTNNTAEIDGAYTVERSVDINVNRTSVQGGATLNVTSGTHSDSQSGNTVRNFLGNDSAGTVNQSGGSYNIGHMLLVGSGSASGTGAYNLTDGNLNVSRAGNSFMGVVGGSSLEIGVGSATGLFEISGGSLVTRIGVGVGAQGTFSVQGSGAISIGIGSSGSLDGKWIQSAGGTLSIGIDVGGVTKVLIDETDDAPGAGNDGIATFELDSELDVSFLGGHAETNAWVIMEAEGGIVDNGLKFAAGVDPLWNFGVTNDPVLGADVLWVGYAGAEYELLPKPPAGTNRFVHAIVPMPETWNLFAPEGGDTALASQSSSGFTATIGAVTDSDYRPAVAQEFVVDQDISQVGQSVTVNFDVELLDPTGNLDTDFRFALYDTNTNYQIVLGMLDMGVPVPTSMRVRIDPEVSRSDSNTNLVFEPGNYSHLCGGGGTLSTSGLGAPGDGLQYDKEPIHIEASVSRTDTNELTIVTTWSNGIDAVISVVLFDELTNPDDVPPGGKWNQLNGFGIKVYDNSPFTAGTGRYEVSNFELSYTTSLPDGFGYNVSDITVEPSGDVILTLSDPIVGAMYTVLAASDLKFDTPEEIGSYVAEAPGIITIPAAVAAPYTPSAFFDVELPVVEVPYE